MIGKTNKNNTLDLKIGCDVHQQIAWSLKEGILGFRLIASLAPGRSRISQQRGSTTYYIVLVVIGPILYCVWFDDLTPVSYYIFRLYDFFVWGFAWNSPFTRSLRSSVFRVKVQDGYKNNFYSTSASFFF